MKKQTRKTEGSTHLKEFVMAEAKLKNMSLRQVAAGVGISPSYFSEVLNGKRPPDVDICNGIAKVFNTQRTLIYQVAGWLDLSQDELYIERFKEYSKSNPDFEKFINMVFDIQDENERKRLKKMTLAALGQ